MQNSDRVLKAGGHLCTVYSEIQHTRFQLWDSQVTLLQCPDPTQREDPLIQVRDQDLDEQGDDYLSHFMLSYMQAYLEYPFDLDPGEALNLARFMPVNHIMKKVKPESDAP